MTYKTYTAALTEKRRMRHPHRIVPVMRHDVGCLFSNGSILPPYPCTCHNARRVGWSLKLDV